MSLTKRELDRVDYWIKRLGENVEGPAAYYGPHISGENCKELAELLQTLRDYA